MVDEFKNTTETKDLSCSTLFLIGPEKCGKKTLLQELTKLAGVVQEKNSTKMESMATSNNFDTVQTIRIENKYYSANVDLVSLPSEAYWQPHTHGARDQIQQADAMIFLFDVSQLESGELEDPFTFDTFNSSSETQNPKTGLRQWTELIVAAGVQAPSTLLCVGTKWDKVKDTRKIQEKMHIWCIEQGFEWVPANLLAPEFTANEREKEGVARIFEAMQAVQWRNLNMKSRSTASQQCTAPKQTSSTQTDVEATESSECTQNSTTPTDQNNTTVSSPLKKESVVSTDQSHTSAEQEVESTMLQNLMSDETPMDESDDMLLQMLHTVKQVRAMGATIPEDDENARAQHRERAADVAMKLWQMLELDLEENANNEEPIHGMEEK